MTATQESPAATSATGQIRGVLDLDLPGPTISRHLYGHFAEHLGRCIYGGLRHWRSPTCAGPAAASPTSTTGATAWARASRGPPW